MTELFGFAALAVGGYYIFKRVQKRLAEAEEALSAMRDSVSPVARQAAKDRVSLVKDPVTGKYRPQES